MAYKKIYESVYGIDLLYFAGCSIEEAERKAKRVFKIQGELKADVNDQAAFFVCQDFQEKIVYIIWLRRSCVWDMAHECVHLVADIFKRRGVPINYSNDEQFAYYLSWWVEKIMEKTPRRQ